MTNLEARNEVGGLKQGQLADLIHDTSDFGVGGGLGGILPSGLCKE